MITRIIILLSIIANLDSQAQIRVGAWREHLSYNNVTHLESYNKQIIALTDKSLFIHNTEDGSVRRISKIEGLYGVDVLSMGIDSTSGLIIVGYDNGYFDVVKNNTVYSYGDIERSSVSGDIGVYHVYFHNNLVYLSTGFGIVVFDPTKNEIKETYFIGVNGNQVRVNDVQVFQNKLYAATNTGIFYANLSNPNLTDFRNWTRVENIPNFENRFNNLEVFNNKLFANYWSPENGGGQTYSDIIYHFDGTSWVSWKTISNGKTRSIRSSGDFLTISSTTSVGVYDNSLSYSFGVGTLETTPKPKYVKANDAVLLNQNELWIGDQKYGLIKWDRNNGLQEYIVPSGPKSNDVVNMSMFNDNLWVASGAVSGTWNNTFSTTGFYSFVNEQWANYSSANNDSLKGTYDFIISTIDPSDNSHVWVGSWAKGLFEIRNGVVVKQYDNTNSILQKDINRTDADFIKVSGLTYDVDGNLWISNPQCNAPLKVLTASGSWHSFEMGNELPTDFPISEIIITDAGYKWMVRPRKKGLFVFDDNKTLDNTNDDRWKAITTEIGSGELPTLSVNAIRLDLDGEMWLGTAEGIAVFYNPDEVFDNESFKAEQILIEQDGNVQILLESEVITSIEIDGANRKWVGTQASGVYLLSSDGTRQIHHFTVNNSPLINNEIKDIVLNHGNGEVFFATSSGIVSFKGTATTGLLENSEPFAYPNPVPPGYDGVIAVKNLVANSFFKVVDIAGNMIYEGQTEGGQAIWNGRTYQGDKVETGIYLFLITDDTGKQTSTAKVLVTK